MYVSSNTKLAISKCLFEENYSMGRGSIISLENLNAYAFVNNSIFMGNYAIMGGVFFTLLYGSIISNNCTFHSNFAIDGGLIYS